MQGDFSSEKPIFIQIAERVEDAILAGAFEEEGQIPSITEFAVLYTINPATALKGVNLLVEEGILYKKRGVGMFVKEGAKEMLRVKRREGFANSYVAGLVAEARRLQIGPTEIHAMIDRQFGEAKTAEGEAQ